MKTTIIQDEDCRVEGYWANVRHPEYPTPIPRESLEKKASILHALDKKEKSARVMRYRGWSTCRLCGCGNGSNAYLFGGWLWPSGFRHYLEEHNVKPSQDFIDFLFDNVL